MQEFSKYRVITAGFILMFIFIVAAIYTNTKDIANKKLKSGDIVQEQLKQPNLMEKILQFKVQAIILTVMKKQVIKFYK